MNPSFTNASLYVGDLTPEVTEALLFEIFREVGPVISIRVCRDTFTRRSLGYSYVNFQNTTDAERALDTLNYAAVRGKPMRIMWSHRDPSIRKSGIGNIYIKNLDKTIDSKTLYDTFSAFGNILSCKVVTDDKGSSKGFGFVHYETQEAADQAIAKVNNMQLGEKVVHVTQFRRKTERFRTGDADIRFTNVYVKNLDESINEQQLQDAFSPFGVITSLVIMRDESGKSKGFGFINFGTPEEAKKAVEAMNSVTLGSNQVYAGRAQKKSEREFELRRKFESMRLERQGKYQGVNLYVKNLDDTIDDEKLRQEFSQFGTITSAKVMRDEKGLSRGFGFVCFSTPEEATKATTDMTGHMFGSKPIYVTLAQTKEDRRAQLEAQYAQRSLGVRTPAAMAVAPGIPPGMYPAGPIFYPTGTRLPPGAQGGFVSYPAMGIPARPRWAPANPAAAAAAAAAAAGGAVPGPQVPGPRGKPRYPMGVVNYPGQTQMQQRGPMAGGPGGVPTAMPGGPMPGRGGAGRRAGPPTQPGAPGNMNGPKAGPAGMSPNGPRGNGNFRYRNNTRNARVPEHAQPMQISMYNPLPPQMAAMGVIPHGAIPQLPPMQTIPMPLDPTMEPLDPTILAQASVEDQKNMIGQRLYPLINAINPNPENSGKLTGMLLDLDNSELLHLLESPEALNERVNEAIAVLKIAPQPEVPHNTEESAPKEQAPQEVSQ